MNIIKKIANKQDFYHQPSATIAVLGDSVSHGCFECYVKNGKIETIYDIKSSYSSRLKEMLNILYPSVQINIINSGISGDSASNGLKRIERDILPYQPDLCIVSYQLNDSCAGLEGLSIYLDSLQGIFTKLHENQIEILFLTENFMCTNVSDLLSTPLEKELARAFATIQNTGIAKAYRDTAINLCKKNHVKYIDFYAVWEKMAAHHVDFDYLLANKLNHPIREFHDYMAIKIIEKMFEEEDE